MRKNIEINTNVKCDMYPTLSLDLPHEAIEELQELYLKRYKKPISVEVAKNKSLQLLKLVFPVYKPIPNVRKDEHYE